jgi:hypothetical protein
MLQKRLGDALDRRESLMEKLNKEQESRASALGEVETWRREYEFGIFCLFHFKKLKCIILKVLSCHGNGS